MADEEDEGVTLHAAKKPETSSADRKEQRQFQTEEDSRRHRNHPNSVMLPFGRSFISWHSDSGVAILALIILCVLVALSGAIILLRSLTEIIYVFSATSLNETWVSDFLKILGQGIVATAGAVVGAGGATIANRLPEKKDK
ncbi:hypothetical protein [Komagataeibacter sp. FNDCR2]|uniref:hypothetical protein n=1 Tax=Komagataeibacter sp. FNDCR2 TaxID=2878682 RepID=UPI001E2EC29A|nr:hypothetical protein [Komagataeibacter sp. FNDCR2]MCE2574808.1 hypothetical protein [Komagataeibacter sp. FNDCR2]